MSSYQPTGRAIYRRVFDGMPIATTPRMIPLIGLLLCVYLVFKGFELFQIAWCAQDPPMAGLVIGVVAVLASIVIAGLFSYMFITSSLAVPSIPALR